MKRYWKFHLALISMAVFLIFSLFSCALRRSDPAIDGNDNPSHATHPALAIISLYKAVDERVNIVNPYLVNLMALDLLRRESHVSQVRDYIIWYMDHLNYPDKYGATGSIYDYRVFYDGREESLESADSLDSYASTFIMLVNRYYQLTGEQAFISSRRQELEDIIYLVLFLQQPGGLTIALPGTTGRYLMDNCEAYGGISAFVELADEFGWDIHSFYLQHKTILGQAIDQHFYDPDRGNYYWLIDGQVKHAANWTKYYPDAFAQLFPILYNITTNPERCYRLWNLFLENHGTLLEQMSIEQQIIYRWTEEIMMTVSSED